MPLNAILAKAAKPKDRPYKLADEKGLYLLVTPSGGKLWRFNYKEAGKYKTAAFGQFPDVSLATARDRRDELRKKCRQELPDDAKATPKAPPFEVVARKWFKAKKTTLATKYSQLILARLEADIFPAFGKTPINEIDPQTVLLALREVEERGAIETARRVKNYVSRIFRYAIAEGTCRQNPASDLADALRPLKKTAHRASLKLSEMPTFFSRLSSATETPALLALRLVLFTAARTAEVRFAQWPEFEGLGGQEPLWRIPEGRMKMGREHLVPLSTQAVRVLRAIRKMGLPSDRLFWADTRSGVISENAMLSILYDHGYYGKATVHGFRGTFSTTANESGLWNKDWIEKALAHDEENEVRSAYNAAEYLPQRRKLLQWWGDLLAEKEVEAAI